MHRIPTRIEGVELLRGADRRHADGSNNLTRKNLTRKNTARTASSRSQQPRGQKPIAQPIAQPHTEGQLFEADFGFTQELSYTRRLPISRAIRCLEGEVFVATADIRVGSPTFKHWQGFYLRENDPRTLIVPPGVACGWQVTSSFASLEVLADADALNLNSDKWRWLRWNDMELAIAWPEIPEQLARQVRGPRSLSRLPDRALPLYSPPKRCLGKTTSTKNSAIAIKPINTSKPTNRVQPVSGFDADNTASKPRHVGPQPILAPPPKSREELILVIGSSGQLGRDLCRHLTSLGTVVGACRQPERGSLLPIPVQVDVSRPASIRQAIRAIKPTLIVNASGLTDLEKSEREPRLAQLVNATAPSVIAEEALQIGSSIVHFCTDMVYDGSGDRPWRETDTPNPINQYGRTKHLGTEAIRRSGVPNLVIRSGWLYGLHGNNYVTQLVDLLTYRNSIELAADHLGTPTSTDWLAATTLSILKSSRTATTSSTSTTTTTKAATLGEWLRQEGGLFHVAPLGYASRVEVGDQIAATCRAHALPIVSNKFQAVGLDSMTRGFSIPANCQLDCSKLALHFGMQLPRWQQQLREHVGLMLTHTKLSMQHVA